MMSSLPSKVALITTRQRAICFFAFGLAVFLFSFMVRSLFSGLPLPEHFFYAPVVPVILMVLGPWLYPTEAISSIRRSLRFQVRVAIIIGALLAPFSLWLTEVPDKHYFQVCSALYFLVLSFSTVFFSRFMALGASTGSPFRMWANYTYYMGMILTVLPFFVFTGIVAIFPGIYFDVFSVIPVWGWVLIAHPALVLCVLLMFWPVASDDDLPTDVTPENPYVKDPADAY